MPPSILLPSTPTVSPLGSFDVSAKVPLFVESKKCLNYAICVRLGTRLFDDRDDIAYLNVITVPCLRKSVFAKRRSRSAELIIYSETIQSL